jgi:hypothetical protein
MSKAGASPQFMALQKHRRKDRERWQSTLQEIHRAQSELPVEFYRGNASQVSLLNAELDEKAQIAFSPVMKIVEGIESGALLVRPLTKADAEDFGSALEDKHTPSDPEESIANVEDFADQLVAILKKFTTEAT